MKANSENANTVKVIYTYFFPISGRTVKPHWVLGMVEDDFRLEYAQTTWKSYNCLSDHGYKHRRVNHSNPDNLFIAKEGTQT